MHLGERIRLLRVQRKLGVSDLALQLGMSAADVEQVEAGQRQLSHQELMGLCEVLGVDVDELFVQDDAAAAEESEGSSVLIPTDRLNALLDQMKKG